jgi:hypothetical protein
VSAERAKPWWRRPIFWLVVAIVLVFVVLPLVLGNTLTAD